MWSGLLSLVLPPPPLPADRANLVRSVTTTARLDRLIACTAGLALGTTPMLWKSIIAFGSLDVRPAHLAGAITLALVLLPSSTAKIRLNAVLGLGAIGTLTVVGAAINSFIYVDAFWPTSELVRFIANLLIALAVVSALPLSDPANARRMGWATSAGLVWALGVWLNSIASTQHGLDGAALAVLRGNTNHLLFGIQLPAMRSLYHDGIMLGTRHGVIFGFLVGASMLHMLTGAAPQDRWLRRVARAISVVVLVTTLLSSSRSAFAMLALAAVVYSISRRAEFVRLGRTYVVAAVCTLIAGTTVASGLLSRFTSDTDSFQSRQGDLTELLDGDWSLAGLNALPAGVNPPHNSFVEMAAGGGALALLAALTVAFLAGLALWPRRSTGLTVFLLASAVLVRIVTAARGSLDTAALLAFAVVLISSPIQPRVLFRTRRQRPIRTRLPLRQGIPMTERGHA